MRDSASLRQEAVGLFRARQFSRAAEAALDYLAVKPLDRPILRLLGDASLGAGHDAAAESTFRLLLGNGRAAFDLAGLAEVLAARGARDRAQALLFEALEKDPALPRAWGLLSVLHEFGERDPLIGRAKRIYRDKTLSPQVREAAACALVKAMNDTGDWSRAWGWAERAKSLDRRPYDPAVLKTWVDDMALTFDPEHVARRTGRGDPTRAPIFVVGSPRSGTTLVEAVIAATGQAAAMGEVPAIPLLTDRAAADDRARGNAPSRHGWTRRWRDQSFTVAADFYLAEIRRRAGGSVPSRFVDKLPGNILHLGQIGLIFPNAAIVRVHRDPLDTCVSCYLGRFAGGHVYTRRPDWLAAAWRSFKRAGDLMAPMLPNPVLDVQYERLVGDPEDETRRIADFLGLDWRQECVRPGQGGYQTTTRSSAEVRATISDRSVRRWRRYARHLGPLAEGLGLDVRAVRDAASLP